MTWYEPEEKTARIDWRCDTPFWKFKITSIDENTFVLSEYKHGTILKVSNDVRKLFYSAFDLQLIHERYQRDSEDEFR